MSKRRPDDLEKSSGVETQNRTGRTPDTFEVKAFTWHRPEGVQVAPEPIQSKVTTVADLGTLIRKVRSERALSQQSLADLAGVGRRFLSELENGKETSEIGLVLRVTSALGIDITARTR